MIPLNSETYVEFLKEFKLSNLCLDLKKDFSEKRIAHLTT